MVCFLPSTSNYTYKHHDTKGDGSIIYANRKVYNGNSKKKDKNTQDTDHYSYRFAISLKSSSTLAIFIAMCPITCN